jgi:hypothetical protein
MSDNAVAKKDQLPLQQWIEQGGSKRPPQPYYLLQEPMICTRYGCPRRPTMQWPYISPSPCPICWLL